MENYETTCKFFRILCYSLETLESNQTFCFGEIDTPIFKIGETYFQYPLTKSAFEEIKKYCKDTPFGSGEETIYNENIRKGWQIEPKDLIINHSYTENIKEELQKIFEIKKLSFEFYKLLIYEKGGHFKRHKDTLRAKNHIGTLLIFLPSIFEGGDFTLYDNNEKYCFNYSMTDSKSNQSLLKSHWLAFYTDCN